MDSKIECMLNKILDRSDLTLKQNRYNRTNSSGVQFVYDCWDISLKSELICTVRKECKCFIPWSMYFEDITVIINGNKHAFSRAQFYLYYKVINHINCNRKSLEEEKQKQQVIKESCSFLSRFIKQKQ